MTLPAVDAILFDVGGTLRKVQRRPANEKLAYIQKIGDLLGTSLPPAKLLARLEKNAGAYHAWSRKTHCAADEAEFWCRWMLPDWPEAQVRELVGPLNEAWRESTALREPFPETRPVILELFRRGYRLGIASNTISTSEVPRLLKELGIGGYFETVTVSGQVKSRKPASGLLLAACADMGIDPCRCAYVGNRPDLDIPAARKAGFASVVVLADPALTPWEGEPADASVARLADLLDLFPGGLRQAASDRYPVPAHASISSSWAIGQFDSLDDFYECARRMGFAQVELNHQVTPAMLENFQMLPGRVSSVHEPCPSQMSISAQAERDWLITSVVESNRRKAVESIQSSIELAERLWARIVVVHCGSVSPDHSLEKELMALYQAGQIASPEAERLRAAMRAQRQAQAGPHLDALVASLKELLAFAAPRGVCLGLENRDYFMQMPHPDEMEILLNLAGPGKVGFVLDVGHAAHLDRLGFFPQRVWLERFGRRLVGMHLHDIQGLADHRAPGQGDLNFSEFQHPLAGFGMKTMELVPSQTVSQIKNGLAELLQKGLLTRNES